MQIVGYKEKKGKFNGKNFHTVTMYVVKKCTKNEEYGDVEVKGLEAFKAKISNVNDGILDRIEDSYINKIDVNIKVNKYGSVVLFE